jgi:hypothetical protein
MLMTERHAGEPEEGEYLQAVAIVIGDAEQLGIGIEREHGTLELIPRKACGA